MLEFVHQDLKFYYKVLTCYRRLWNPSKHLSQSVRSFVNSDFAIHSCQATFTSSHGSPKCDFNHIVIQPA